jgi:serine protease
MRCTGFAAALLAAGSWIACAAWPGIAAAADSVVFLRHVDPTATDQVIVKWRDQGVAATQLPSIEARTARLRASTGTNVQPAHNLYGQVDVLKLDRPLSAAAMRPLIEQLRLDPSVEYAEPDGWRFIEATLDTAPNDPHFVAGSDAYGSWLGQWYLKPSSSTTPSAISATTAWETTTGSASVIVAVIDTGIIAAHPDLAGKLLPGYDFVSCDQGNEVDSNSTIGLPDATCASTTSQPATYDFANDGTGWDNDPSDPGDWISTADTQLALFQNAGCTTAEPSSWHGTRVAGIIGAVTNNGIGIAGIAPATMLLPIRAIGVCTGRVSDLAAAITWAYGGTVTGVPTNPTANKASIINLSLGAATACSQTEQDAISNAIAANVLVVAAAGNAGGPVNAPANCSGVVSVAGLREAGTKVGYSSLSSADAAVTISAPAGNCVNTSSTEPCEYSIETTSDAGSTTPATTPGFYTYALLNASYLSSGANPDNAANVGTSFAAPMVAGVAALMLAVNPGLTPSELISRITATTSVLPFPTSSSTTSTQCALALTTTDSDGNYTDTSQAKECVCTTATCGAGMLNAAAAVTTASGIFVDITTSSTTGSPGDNIALNGSGSTASTGDTIVSWHWSTIPSTSDQIRNPDSPEATLVVPSFRSIQVKLTIVDSGGHTASGTVTIRSAFAAATGSGAFGPELLILAALTAAVLWRRRYQRRVR